MKTKKYADGGKARKPKGRKVVRSADRSSRASSVGSTTDTLRNARQRQMDELGLKDGGPVNTLPRPERGATPRRITTANAPGGRRVPKASANKPNKGSFGHNY